MSLKKLLILLLDKFIKKTFYFSSIFLLIGCSNYYFVYNNNFDDFLEKTNVFIKGNDYEIIKSNFIDNNKKTDVIKFELEINSLKETKSAVIENDQTASSIEVKYIIDYKFSSIQKNCVVLNKKITNSSTYKSRAEGFNFGTDLSKAEISKQLIEDNINSFFQAIKTISDTFDCLNED